MKPLGSLLVAISLTIGVIGTVTAYQPSIEAVEAHALRSGAAPLTLNAPAGLKLDESGEPMRNARGPLAPLAQKDEQLTPELVEKLKASGVRYVKVKEFSLARWPGWWLFLLGCAGLSLGAWLMRSPPARPNGAASAEPASVAGARDSLAALCGEIDALLAEHERAAGEPPRERLNLILTRLGNALATHAAAFVAARPEITATHGLSGFARVMDRFAAAERQLNRAWSAAADQVEDESLDCLRLGRSLLDEAAARLAATSR